MNDASIPLEVLDRLTFQPFDYQEAPAWEDGPLSPSEETRHKVYAGAVLKLKDGSIYLVGDCNEILGVCDDCTEFQLRDVDEIAYLWGEE